MAVMAPLTMCLGWRCSRVMCLPLRHSWFCARFPSQGGLHNSGGTATFNDCQLTSNSGYYIRGYSHDDDSSSSGLFGMVAYGSSVSATSFFSCSFVGDYEDDVCVIDSDGTLEFYFTQAFSNGTVCSDATTAIVVYNGDAVVPFSSSSSAELLSCQGESISAFCAFDCAAGLGGVGIECR